MEEFRKAMYQTCLNANIPILSRDTAAKILAVVYLQGGDERITLSPKIKCDLEYIQDRFDIHGGETMDAELHRRTKAYIRDCEAYFKSQGEKQSWEWPKWANDLFQERYGFKPYKL